MASCYQLFVQLSLLESLQPLLEYGLWQQQLGSYIIEDIRKVCAIIVPNAVFSDIHTALSSSTLVYVCMYRLLVAIALVVCPINIAHEFGGLFMILQLCYVILSMRCLSTMWSWMLACMVLFAGTDGQFAVVLCTDKMCPFLFIEDLLYTCLTWHLYKQAMEATTTYTSSMLDIIFQLLFYFQTN